MATEKTVPASDFVRNFGRYRDEAAAGEIVQVTSHGRVIGGYLSARQLDEYRELLRYKKESYRVDTMPDDVAEELEEGLRASEYGN